MRILAHLLLFLLPGIVFGQKVKPSLLYAMVENAKVKNTFTETRLFTQTAGRGMNQQQLDAYISEKAILQINTTSVLNLFKKNPDYISLSVPFNNETFQLDMVEYTLNNGEPIETGVIENGIHKKRAMDPGIHYRGYIHGQPGSMACISVFSDGTMMGLFANEKGNFVIGKIKNSAEYVLYNDKNLKIPINISCTTPDEPEAPETEIQQRSIPPTTLCKSLRVYWEADYNLYNFNFNNNLPNTQNYVNGLFNEFATIYQNEGVVVQLSSTFFWTTQDPYGTTNSQTGINDFKTRWNGMGNSFNGDLAHLIAGRPLNNGGVAFIDVLCQRDRAYAYSNVNANFLPFPQYSWDLMVVSHETGHNLSSRHTHWCGWNTGPNGTCGAIDNCTNLEYGAGCSTCPTTYDKNQPGWDGTIMSYCHLTSIGINLANGFGPLPQNKIRTRIATSSCLPGNNSVPPTASASPNPLCEGGILDLSTTNGSAYLWEGPNEYSSTVQNPQIQNIGFSYSGVYTVTVLNSSGCGNFSSVSVTVNQAPAAVITPPGPINLCEGFTSSLQANIGSGYSYQWKKDNNDIPGANGTSYTVNASGVYSVLVTSTNLCTKISNLVNVSVNPLPTANITASGSTELCEGAVITLSANTGSGLTYQWQKNNSNIPGAIGSTLIVNATGTYRVIITNSFQCNRTSNEILVNVNPIPTAAIAPSGPIDLCQTQTALLQATTGSGYTYQWRRDNTDIPGATDASYLASVSGSYTVSISNGFLCSALSTPVVVTIYPLPQAFITPAGPIEFCAGGSIVLTAGSGTGYIYQWKKNGTALQGATSQSLTVFSSGNYSVVIKNPANCENTSTEVVVNVKPAPNANITYSGSLTRCLGDTIKLTASSGTGYTYQWKKNGSDIPGADQSTLVVSEPGKYVVVITGPNDCQATAQEVTVSFNSKPSLDLVTPDGASSCEGKGVYITTNAHFDKVSWSTGEQKDTIYATKSGVYKVTVSNTTGCQNSDSIEINIYQNPVISLNPGSEATFCSGGSAKISADGGAQYHWSTNEDTKEITITEEGTYMVTVTTDHGCSSTASIHVTQSNQLSIKIVGPDLLCKGDTDTLSTVSGYESYKWSNNSEEYKIPVTESGVYSVTVSDQSGCTGVTSKEVTVIDAKINASITVPDSVFEQSQTIINITPQPGWTYQWEVSGGEIIDGQNTPQINIKWLDPGIGTIRLIATNQGLCVDTIIWTVIIKKIIIGSEDLRFMQPSLYPNPASGQLYITNISQTGYSYEIYDIMGRVRLKGRQAVNQPIHINDLTAGIYMIKFSGDESQDRYFLRKFSKN